MAMIGVSPTSRKLLFAVLGVVSLLAILAGFRVFGEAGPHADAAEPVLPVSVLTVRLQDHYETERGFTGRAVSRRGSDLGFESGGKLAEMRVDAGDRVEAGDLLARLDTDRLRARRRELSAQLREAEADFVLAEKTRARNETLFRQGHVSAQRLDEAVAEADAAQARRAALSASIASVDVDLAKAELRAPYGGVIERRMIDEGTVIEAGTPVLRLLESHILEAEVGLPLSFALSLTPGDHVPLASEKGELVFARVKAIVPAIRGETRTALVTFEIAGQVAAIVADGSLVTARLPERMEASGFWMPLRALSADVRGLWRVYKVRKAEDGTARVTFENVQILHSEGSRAFVSGTVGDGDLLIDAGTERLAPGKKVRIVRIDGVPVAARDGA